MFPRVNPAQMRGMMKKMGISQTQINVRKVIFEMEEGNLIIDEPSVIRIMMQGQETYQVSGEAREEESKNFSEEDIAIVIEKTGKSEEEVLVALGASEGDIAEAIMELKD